MEINMDCNRKTVVITGASRGIGRAAAMRFASSQYNVVINCIHNEDKLIKVRDYLRSKGAGCVAFTGDISDYDTARTMFELAHNTFGPTDILINNAGISIVGLFQDLTRKEWDRIFNVNTGSLYNCCHFAVPDMIHNHCGKIINISSVWGVCGASCEVAYSATKGAVNAFTKALAKELAPSNIQVNAIACGAKIFSLINQEKEIDVEESENQFQNIEAGRVDINDVDFSYVPDGLEVGKMLLTLYTGLRQNTTT